MAPVNSRREQREGELHEVKQYTSKGCVKYKEICSIIYIHIHDHEYSSDGWMVGEMHVRWKLKDI